MRKIQKRLLPLIPSAHLGPGNETTVKSATLLDSGCAFFTAVHVVTCAYANFNPLYSLDCARAGRLIVGAGSSSYNSYIAPRFLVPGTVAVDPQGMDGSINRPLITLLNVLNQQKINIASRTCMYI